MNNFDFVKSSYIKHKNFQKEIFSHLNKKNKYWIDENNYDYWRHKRMYSFVDAIICCKDTWLTIGDAMGTDAHYLLNKGIKNVLATDISGIRLKYAFDKFKYIKKYKVENAEHISQENNSFDYVLCKESLHHFPRPIIAIYEMLRVVNKGVVLIEPNDVKALFSRKYVNHFETVGNYVYSLSIREIEKIAYAISLDGYAYKGFDDIYLKDGGKISLSGYSFKVVLCKLFLKFLTLLKNIGIRDNSLICVIIFKKLPNKNVIAKLIKSGYLICKNIQNPYLK